MTTDPAGLTPDQLEALRQLANEARPIPRFETGSGRRTAATDLAEARYHKTRSALADAVPALLEQLATIIAERDTLRQQQTGGKVTMDSDQLARLRETVYRAFAHDEDAALVERALASLSQLATITAERNELQDTLHRADALRYRLLADRDHARQQSERYRAALVAIAEWRHDDGCEVAQHPFYECSCTRPGPWAIARDALKDDAP